MPRNVTHDGRASRAAGSTPMLSPNTSRDMPPTRSRQRWTGWSIGSARPPTTNSWRAQRSTRSNARYGRGRSRRGVVGGTAGAGGLRPRPSTTGRGGSGALTEPKPDFDGGLRPADQQPGMGGRARQLGAAGDDHRPTERLGRQRFADRCARPAHAGRTRPPDRGPAVSAHHGRNRHRSRPLSPGSASSWLYPAGRWLLVPDASLPHRVGCRTSFASHARDYRNSVTAAMMQLQPVTIAYVSGRHSEIKRK